MRRRQFLGASALLAGLGAAPAARACRLFPSDAAERYVAWQADQQVGWQAISFSREPGRFMVQVSMEMDLRSRQSGTWRYRHESREIWETGWLQALQSRTRIGAREQLVSAGRRDGSLLVEGSDVRSYRLSTYIVPSNLWHRDSRLVDTFIDVESGHVLFVQPRYVGEETLVQAGGRVAAHHYRLRGQFHREAWYDADCALVRWDLPLGGDDWIRFLREPV